MSLVGLDPVAGPLLASALEEAGRQLWARAARLDALRSSTAEAGLLLHTPVTVRGVAVALEDQADDLRRRVRAVLDDTEGFFAEVWDFLGGDLLSLWNGGQDDEMPWGRWLAGALREAGVVKFLRLGGSVVPYENPLPLFNSGAIGGRLARYPAFAWLSSGPTTAVLRAAGIAGGLYTGVSGTVGLVRRGNPIRAYAQEGAGYVADVAGTAFGYSSAAFLVAPNPVTGAVVVGTGAVWLGAEAWDHRDDIAGAWNSAAAWTGDGVVALDRWAVDRADEVNRWAGRQAGELLRLSTGAGDVAGTVASGAGNVAGRLFDRAAFWR